MLNSILLSQHCVSELQISVKIFQRQTQHIFQSFLLRMAEYLMEEIEMSSVSSHDKENEDGYEFEIVKSTVIKPENICPGCRLLIKCNLLRRYFPRRRLRTRRRGNIFRFIQRLVDQLL